MDQRVIVEFVTALPGVVAMTADEASGAPEIAWGDTFFSYEVDGAAVGGGWTPFATIVTKDYPAFDTASNLDRDSVFRLNIAVGRKLFKQLLGYPPEAHAEQASRFDYTVTDRVLPHPVYAVQGWICIVAPTTDSVDVIRELLTQAHSRAIRLNSGKS